MHETPRSRRMAYGIGLLATIVAIFLRWHLHGLLGERALYSTVLPAVMIAAYFGGFRPGLMMTLLGALGTNYFVSAPAFTLSPKGTGDSLALILFVLTGTFISVLSESLHRAQWRIVADERRRAEAAIITAGSTVL